MLLSLTVGYSQGTYQLDPGCWSDYLVGSLLKTNNKTYYLVKDTELFKFQLNNYDNWLNERYKSYLPTRPGIAAFTPYSSPTKAIFNSTVPAQTIIETKDSFIIIKRWNADGLPTVISGSGTINGNIVNLLGVHASYYDPFINYDINDVLIMQIEVMDTSRNVISKHTYTELYDTNSSSIPRSWLGNVLNTNNKLAFVISARSNITGNVITGYGFINSDGTIADTLYSLDYYGNNLPLQTLNYATAVGNNKIALVSSKYDGNIFVYLIETNTHTVVKAKKLTFPAPTGHLESLYSLRTAYDPHDNELYLLTAYSNLHYFKNNPYIEFILVRMDTDLNIIEGWKLFTYAQDGIDSKLSYRGIILQFDSLGNPLLVVSHNSRYGAIYDSWTVNDSFATTFFYLQDNSNIYKEPDSPLCCAFTQFPLSEIRDSDLTNLQIYPIHRDSVLRYYGSTDTVTIKTSSNTTIVSINRNVTSIPKTFSTSKIVFNCDSPQFSYVQSVSLISNNNDFKVWYDHLSKTLTIKCENTCPNFSIYNSLGKLAYTIKPQNTETIRINVNLPSGIYLLSPENTHTPTYKLIIQD